MPAPVGKNACAVGNVPGLVGKNACAVGKNVWAVG